MIHTFKGFGVVNKADIDVFLELSCFFNDPVEMIYKYSQHYYFRVFIAVSRAAGINFEETEVHTLFFNRMAQYYKDISSFYINLYSSILA